MDVPPVEPRRLDLTLRPGQSALISGDYGMGKTRFAGQWAQSVGRAAFWAAPVRPGALPDYSEIGRVVHNAKEMQQAALESGFVVWPSPPLSQGIEAALRDLNDFCAVALTFQNAVIVFDEMQRLLPKFLKDAPPRFQDMVEFGHKPPNRLAKVYVGHRQAQLPLNLAGGAYRISFRPFPGDEDALAPFYTREGVERMKRMGVGEFAFWSQATGPVLPCRLNQNPVPSTYHVPGGPAL